MPATGIEDIQDAIGEEARIITRGRTGRIGHIIATMRTMTTTITPRAEFTIARITAITTTFLAAVTFISATDIDSEASAEKVL